MAPVKTERYQNNGPVHAYLCAWALLSLGVRAMALAFHHAVTQGQAMLSKCNFLLLAFKTLVFYLRQRVHIAES